MTSEGASRPSGETVVPRGTLPVTAGATVIVALGQLFDDESWRRAFAVGGPALAAVGSTAWRWLAERLEPWIHLRTGLRQIDRWLQNPDTRDEDRAKLEAERNKLRMAYLDLIRRGIDGRNRENQR